MGKPENILSSIFFGLLFFVFMGLSASSIGDTSSQIKLESFANIKGHRFYIVQIAHETTSTQIKGFIESQVANDRGRGTHAFFYEPGSRLPTIISQAKDVFNATGIIYDNPRFDGWRYAYQKSLNGTESFVDCTVDTKNDLCRQ